MRCGVCGRPLKDAQGVLTEPLYAAEIARGVTGCLGGVTGCKNAQEHQEREIDAYELQTLDRWQKIAAGKRSDNGVALKIGTPAEVAAGTAEAISQQQIDDAKADAQVRIASLTAHRAARAAEKAAMQAAAEAPK